MQGLRRSRRGLERGRKGVGVDHWSEGGRGQQSCGGRCRGVEMLGIGPPIDLRRPGWTLSGSLDLGLDLDVCGGVGLRLELSLCLWFCLLLLLQQDLVVQKLELSWVPVK